jgi:hypothetical protein
VSGALTYKLPIARKAHDLAIQDVKPTIPIGWLAF